MILAHVKVIPLDSTFVSWHSIRSLVLAVHVCNLLHQGKIQYFCANTNFMLSIFCLHCEKCCGSGGGGGSEKRKLNLLPEPRSTPGG